MAMPFQRSTGLHWLLSPTWLTYIRLGGVVDSTMSCQTQEDIKGQRVDKPSRSSRGPCYTVDGFDVSESSADSRAASPHGSNNV
ncbi:uncharacterized protein G2W53_014170 [Senna tora]|uniref:Uncharacterized protein n=1 Tax=Senna tora TaxID=362788 RepID=A0A834WT09_9FABA|nr:uncharacterized protein G2W53_014170 [Senna tora]